MSRRRGEFEHRTSIFEGAFRAWSHLGGLDPDDVENKPATELDPLSYPLESDPRIGKPDGTKNLDGSPRREYPYEPLPRSGLAHPYVQAILSPWLGPDADNEAIQLGLTTLRTWWQHRRKGESGSAIAALGTEKMKGVVEGYTRHFFTLAHCIVVNEKVQPPRSLHTKIKDLEKIRTKNKKKKKPIASGDLNAIQSSLMDSSLTPLEKLHHAQRYQQEATGANMGAAPIINLKGKCVPGKIDLPGVVDAVNRHTQFVHRGGGADAMNGSGSLQLKEESFGDPNTTPVVFVSSNGSIQIALKVDGITCAHCVKIVETVLRGCNGNKSPIQGLLDAAADRDLCSVLIRIDKAGNAKRIAFEATRNLSMVGYSAKAMSMSIVGEGTKGRTDLNALSTAFEIVATTKPQDVFDWTISCTCPDNGVLRGDCMRHSQMNTRIFEAFNEREQEVKQYMAGCGMKYGMDCTCGPSCSCINCPVHSGNEQDKMQSTFSDQGMIPGMQLDTVHDFDDGALHIDQPMQLNNFGMEFPSTNVAAPNLQPLPFNAPAPMNQYPSSQQISGLPSTSHQQTSGGATRNPSILSYRGSIRHNNMSITSETFGRAMSGLSALSIDWENLEDFDVDLDHSANIQQHRASIRRSIVPQPAPGAATDNVQQQQAHNNNYAATQI